jgi:hypothetical protein
LAKDFHDTPDLSEPGVSHLQEDVLEMLERGEIDTNTCDAIMVLIENAERADMGEPRKKLTLKVVETILGFDPSNHHNAAACPYCAGK